MQLRLDAADRLVELVEERRGPVVADEAARRLFALRQAPVALARSLLADVVAADARLAWNGDTVTLARPPGGDLLLETATYVVVDLETTGLRPGSSQICEIGAVRIRGLELDGEFETLVNPGHADGAGRLRADGPARHRAPQRAAAAGRGQPVPRLRRRRGARRPQRALRPRVPRPGDRAAHRLADRRTRRGHRAARAPPPGGTRAAGEPRPARALPRHVRAAVPPGTAGRAGDRGGARSH